MMCFVTIVCVIGGALLGVASIYSVRTRLKQLYVRFRWFQHASAAAEWVVPFVLGVIAVTFELWRRDTLHQADAATLVLYGTAGCLIGFSAAFKWFIAAAKDDEKAEIASLERRLATASRQRDFLLQTQAQVGEIVRAKQARFASAREVGVRDLQGLAVLLNPTEQMQLLVKVLHEHFARDVRAPSRLRVGIYARDEHDSQKLVAAASWDGHKDDCFSNRHSAYMRIDNPGGARSLVVECYRSNRAMHCIADTAVAAAENPPRFTFFSPEQRANIRSIVAYRYNLFYASPPAAIVLTLDTDIPNFFSPDREFECEILLQEIGRRLDMELVTLELLRNSTDQKPDDDTQASH